MGNLKKAILGTSIFLFVSIFAAHPAAGVTETELFMKNINKYAPTLSAEYTEIELKTTGKAICNNLERGAKVKRVVKSLLLNFNKIETGVLLSSSVVAFCPEQTPKIEKYFNL